MCTHDSSSVYYRDEHDYHSEYRTHIFTGGGHKQNTGRVVLRVGDNIFNSMVFDPALLDIWPKGEIDSLKNVVCYRKDTPVDNVVSAPPHDLQEVRGSDYNSIDHLLDTEGFQLLHLVIAGKADFKEL